MADNQSELALQEVDEDLRRERMQAAWKQYGKYVIGAAVGIVLVVAGREGYVAYTTSVELENAERFAGAQELAGEPGANAVDIWRGAAADLSEGYAALARFQSAAASLKKEDYASAITAYDAIAADGSVTESYQDLARLLAAMSLMTSGGDRAEVRSRLLVIAVEGRTWYYSAVEQLALLDLVEGNKQQAYAAFNRLSLDPSAPQGLQQRAGEYETMLREPLPPIAGPASAEGSSLLEDNQSDATGAEEQATPASTPEGEGE